jgi:hypothetical protein
VGRLAAARVRRCEAAAGFRGSLLVTYTSIDAVKLLKEIDRLRVCGVCRGESLFGLLPTGKSVPCAICSLSGAPRWSTALTAGALHSYVCSTPCVFRSGSMRLDAARCGSMRLGPNVGLPLPRGTNDGNVASRSAATACVTSLPMLGVGSRACTACAGCCFGVLAEECWGNGRGGAQLGVRTISWSTRCQCGGYNEDRRCELHEVVRGDFDFEFVVSYFVEI